MYKFVVLILTLLVSVPAFCGTESDVGGKEGHGGDAYAQEFLAVANEGIEILKRNSAPEADSMESSLKSIRVISQQSVSVGEEEVASVYVSEKNLFVLNRQAWDTFSHDQKLNFAIEKLNEISQLHKKDEVAAKLKETIDKEKSDRLALRTRGLEVLKKYVEVARQAVVFNRDEYLHDVKLVSESKNFVDCFSWSNSYLEYFGLASPCKRFGEEVKNIGAFRRIIDGLDGGVEHQLAEFMNSLPKGSFERQRYAFWAWEIQSDFERSQNVYNDVARQIVDRKDFCSPQGVFISAEPSCIYKVFVDAVSGYTETALDRNAQYFNEDAERVLKYAEAFVNE